MYNYEVVKRVSFDAAHYLPDYDGKCNQMHGHTWYLEVGVSGSSLKDGILFDFSELKKKLKELCESYDHKVLNDLDDFKNEPPTAENIGRLVYERLEGTLPEGIALSFVRLNETADSWVTVRKVKE
ncbi:MAG: 6-carboxytetrahydropterin synthase QueD [Halanaerobiales bacterium]|nr:6-carboxytetrahydropterin synthase QueD [Halanaerobiales bacterium]